MALPPYRLATPLCKSADGDGVMDDAKDVSGFDNILLVDDCISGWRFDSNDGDPGSPLNSFLIASTAEEDDAGVSSGGALLPPPVEVCFLDFDPILSDDESCDFCATC